LVSANPPFEGVTVTIGFTDSHREELGVSISPEDARASVELREAGFDLKPLMEEGTFELDPREGDFDFDLATERGLVGFDALVFLGEGVVGTARGISSDNFNLARMVLTMLLFLSSSMNKPGDKN
jgi:hypothetical protein